LSILSGSGFGRNPIGVPGGERSEPLGTPRT
jgi:hypothetical protein